MFNDYDFTNLISRIDSGEKLAIDTDTVVSVCGVVVAARRMGKIAFVKVVDNAKQIQVVLNQNQLGDEYKQIMSNIALGVHARFSGNPCVTSTKEKSIYVTVVAMIKTDITPFPDKWNGISHDEKRRLRYQDALVNPQVHNVIRSRAKLINVIRNFLSNRDFIEVDTPILHSVSAGAAARPFTTHCNALDGDFFLRIAPETYLKRMTAGGFHKLFEIGKQFRNEGIDSSHMPEFTSCEWYEAYTDCYDQMANFSLLLIELRKAGFTIGNGDEDLISLPYYDYMELYNQYSPISFQETPQNMVDENFKKYVRPNLAKMCFVANYPAFLAPLAKRNENNPEIAEMWQFIWNGFEVVKCYTELTDAIEQRKLLEAQMAERVNGNDEAMMLDEAFLEAMEFGMPPQAGLGLGIDRLLALSLGIDDIRDVVFFPPGQ